MRDCALRLELVLLPLHEKSRRRFALSIVMARLVQHMRYSLDMESRRQQAMNQTAVTYYPRVALGIGLMIGVKV